MQGENVPARSDNKSWAKDTGWILSATVLRNVGLIVILVLLARLTSADVVGRYALALAMTTPFFIFAQLGLKGVYLTMQADYRFRSYVLVQVVTLFLAFVASLVAALIFTPGVTLTVALVAAIKAADAMSDIFSGPMQKYRNAYRVFVAYFIGALAGSAVTATALALTGLLDAALAGLLVISVFTAIVLMGFPARRLTMRHEDTAHARLHPQEDRRAILRAGLPMGVAGAILALVSSMPQFFLARSYGEAVVGVFAVLLYVLAVVEIFTGSLTLTWIPRARRALKDHENDLHRFFKLVAATAGLWTLAFIPAAVLGLWVMSLVLPAVLGPHYTIRIEEALPLALGVILLPAVHFSGTAIAVRNFWVQGVAVSVAAATASLVACVVLVAPLGVAGGLWATASAFAARAVLSFAILYRRSSRLAQSADVAEPQP